MGRVIAIDYGSKRSGLAVSDDTGMIAAPLVTLSPGEIIPYLEEYFKKYNVDTIVVGLPVDLAGKTTHSSAEADAFCQQLTKKFTGKKIHRTDERFTSKMAVQSLVLSGAKMKTRKDKKIIDQVSAVIILQSYLDRLSR